MTLKRWLIALPLVVVAALAQSYFWVPTYEHQSTGNPARLSKYIDASIGDAEVLNPILNADTVEQSDRAAGVRGSLGPRRGFRGSAGGSRPTGG